MANSAILKIAVVLTAAIVLPAGASPAPTNTARTLEALNRLYLSIYGLTQSPPTEAPLLDKVCQAHTHGHYLTFLGVNKHRPIFVAITPRPISDPSKVIRLTPLYVMKHNLPHPIGYDPRVKDATMNWGYVLDRNKDGHVDYLAFLESPLPVPPADYPGELPPVLGNISGKAFKLGFKHTHMVFWQAVDTNFDGSTNDLITPLMDWKSGWVDATLVLSQSKPGSEDSRCEYFAGTTFKNPTPCTARGNEYVVPGKKILGFPKFPPSVDFLKRINEAASQCNFGTDSFYQTAAQLRKALAESAN